MTEILEKHVLEQVRPEHVFAAYEKVGDLIEKACDFSGQRFNPETVAMACSGQHPKLNWQMWLVFDPNAKYETFGQSVKAMAVTSLAQYPTGLLVGEVILIAGRGQSSEWLQYVDDLKNWARANGADRLQFIGRRGFQRILGSDWKAAATMYEFDLNGAEHGRDEQRH